jgi:hypothetical protein
MDIVLQPTGFNSLFVSKQNGHLRFHSMKNYETRNESTAKQIQIADYIYNFDDFDWIIINTDDMNIGNLYNNMKVFSYSTDNNDYSHVCPDFVMDAWPQVQIEDYQLVNKNMSIIGDTPSETNLLGWRGVMSHPNRYNLLKYTDRNMYDIEEINWDRTNPEKLTCLNYVSLPESGKRWRYLIDVEGRGYSARVKLLLFSKRVLFLQERPHKEWFYESLIPWKHYVPIKRDLSDLEVNLKIIQTDTQLEDTIRMNAYMFATNNLQRKHAIERWGELLKNANI